MGAIVFIGAIAGYIVDRNHGPIAWMWDLNSPLGHSRSFGGPLWIDGFQIKGTNVSDDPVSSIKAFVRSDITTKIYPLKFSDPKAGLIPAENVSIPPRASFTLHYVIPSTDPKYSQGIIVDQFRIDFQRFTFIFDHDGQKFIKHFSSKEVDGFIEDADRATRDALKPSNPGIVKN